MIVHQQCYLAQDGYHFPDTFLGSELYYSIDTAAWLDNVDGRVITDTAWTTSDNITISDSYNEGSVLFVKLLTLQRGTFKVTCTLQIQDPSTRTQKKVIPINLKVY